MAYRDADPQFESEYRRRQPMSGQRNRDDSSWDGYNGDGPEDRESQHAHGSDWYDRNERRREARLQHYMGPLYEDYGSPYERHIHFDPDINRRERSGNPAQHPYSWREGGRFTDREQDYRGARWNRNPRSYHNGHSPEEWRGERYSQDYENPESREYGDYSGGSTEQDFWRQENPGTEDVPAYDQRFGRGGFAGIAPKNYQRSDVRIEEDICERLTAHPGIDPSNIEIKVVNGEVVLTGEVPNRRMKRMAEDLAEEISGVRDIKNHVQVAKPQAARVAYEVSSRHSPTNGQHH